MQITRFVCNMVRENTYLLAADNGEAALIDCGAFYPEEQDAISRYLDEHHLHLTHLYNTHAHFDHIFGADFVYRKYGVKIELSEEEKGTYEQAVQQMRQFIGTDLPLALPPVGRYFKDGDELELGHIRLQVIATPGHTPGGVCFYVPEEKVLLSGDNLFRHEIGRCDLPGGNEHSLVQSLKQRILTLPDDVQVLPGHGEASTIAEERKDNFYLR